MEERTGEVWVDTVLGSEIKRDESSSGFGVSGCGVMVGSFLMTVLFVAVFLSTKRVRKASRTQAGLSELSTLHR
jgi:hypothetical protein